MLKLFNFFLFSIFFFFYSIGKDLYIVNYTTSCIYNFLKFFQFIYLIIKINVEKNWLFPYMCICYTIFLVLIKSWKIFRFINLISVVILGVIRYTFPQQHFIVDIFNVLLIIPFLMDYLLAYGAFVVYGPIGFVKEVLYFIYTIFFAKYTFEAPFTTSAEQFRTITRQATNHARHGRHFLVESNPEYQEMINQIPKTPIGQFINMSVFYEDVYLRLLISYQCKLELALQFGNLIANPNGNYENKIKLLAKFNTFIKVTENGSLNDVLKAAEIGPNTCRLRVQIPIDLGLVGRPVPGYYVFPVSIHSMSMTEFMAADLYVTNKYTEFGLPARYGNSNQQQ